MALVSALALLVQGYHFGVDDSAVYLPAVEQRLHPQLFPYGADMFQAHARLSIFAPLVAASVRLSHLPLQWALLLWQLFCIWLLLVASLSIARRCFLQSHAQWAAVLTLACVLPVPVAGTALSIMDPFITARTLSTPLTLLSIACLVAKRPGWAWFLLLMAVTVHPLMGVAALAFMLAIKFLPRLMPRSEQMLAAVAFPFGRAAEPYRQTVLSRGFLFPAGWAWFEWFGVLVPLAALGVVARRPPRNTLPAVPLLAAAAVLVGTLATVCFLVLGLGFEQLYRLQPMRVFQIVSIFFFLFVGGFLGEYLLRQKRWRWIAIFASLAGLLFAVDRIRYPASSHVEWPESSPRNPWVQAFDWVRDNTPQNAVFALPPRYMNLPYEQGYGFRAIAQRSMLADALKDSGPVSVFPAMAVEWERDQKLTRGWNHYNAGDFAALAARSPVTWVLVEPRQSSGLDCPYRNAVASVCRLHH